jgi:hypothetical protein
MNSQALCSKLESLGTRRVLEGTGGGTTTWGRLRGRVKKGKGGATRGPRRLVMRPWGNVAKIPGLLGGGPSSPHGSVQSLGLPSPAGETLPLAVSVRGSPRAPTAPCAAGRSRGKGSCAAGSVSPRPPLAAELLAEIPPGGRPCSGWSRGPGGGSPIRWRPAGLSSGPIGIPLEIDLPENYLRSGTSAVFVAHLSHGKRQIPKMC